MIMQYGQNVKYGQIQSKWSYWSFMARPISQVACLWKLHKKCGSSVKTVHWYLSSVKSYGQNKIWPLFPLYNFGNPFINFKCISRALNQLYEPNTFSNIVLYGPEDTKNHPPKIIRQQKNSMICPTRDGLDHQDSGKPDLRTRNGWKGIRHCTFWGLVMCGLPLQPDFIH